MINDSAGQSCPMQFQAIKERLLRPSEFGLPKCLFHTQIRQQPPINTFFQQQAFRDAVYTAARQGCQPATQTIWAKCAPRQISHPKNSRRGALQPCAIFVPFALAHQPHPLSPSRPTCPKRPAAWTCVQVCLWQGANAPHPNLLLRGPSNSARFKRAASQAKCMESALPTLTPARKLTQPSSSMLPCTDALSHLLRCPCTPSPLPDVDTATSTVSLLKPSECCQNATNQVFIFRARPPFRKSVFAPQRRHPCRPCVVSPGSACCKFSCCAPSASVRELS